jgi:hypothetical protein
MRLVDLTGGKGADVASDGIVDDVGALAAGEIHHARDEVFVAVVDDFVGAVLPRDLQLFGATRGGDDARSQGLPDLHRCDPDTARRSVHQQVFAGPEIRSKDEPCVGGRIDDGERGPLRERHAGRQPVGAGRWRDRDLREPPEPRNGKGGFNW